MCLKSSSADNSCGRAGWERCACVCTEYFSLTTVFRVYHYQGIFRSTPKHSKTHRAPGKELKAFAREFTSLLSRRRMGRAWSGVKRPVVKAVLRHPERIHKDDADDEPDERERRGRAPGLSRGHQPCRPARMVPVSVVDLLHYVAHTPHRQKHALYR